MDSSRNKKYITVLMILCSFLVGVVCGFLVYPIYNSYIAWQRYKAYSYESTDEEQLPRTTVVRKDVLFYKPGDEYVWGPYNEIPEGDGLIKGHFFVDDKPGTNMGIELIIASGRKTKRTTVKGDGSYEIPIEKGEYFLNGIIISDKTGIIDTKIFANKVAKEEGVFAVTPMNNDLMVAEFQELEAKYGPEEASRKVAQKLQDVMTLQERYRFEVTDQGAVLPDFNYRKPIKIILPSYNSIVTLDNLRFVWEAVAGADSYGLRIAHVKQRGTGFSSMSVLTCDGIRNNVITYDNALLNSRESTFGHGFDRQLNSGETYGLKIIAFDKENSVISASSAEIGMGSIFRVE